MSVSNCAEFIIPCRGVRRVGGCAGTIIIVRAINNSGRRNAPQAAPARPPIEPLTDW